MVEYESPEVIELGEIADVTRTGGLSPARQYDDDEWEWNWGDDDADDGWEDDGDDWWDW
jgi:hypothetical protein